MNVQYTLGAGEPAPAARSAEIVVRTLAALAADLRAVSIEVVGPAQGAIQIVSLGVD